MKKNEKMILAINEFILDSDFITGFITDNVKEIIYDEREYHISMIERVIENDLEAGYSNSYITDYILDEIDIYEIADKIHERYKEKFNEIADQTQQRNY